MPDTTYHLAQDNIVVATERLAHPRLDGFVRQLVHFDELARRSPGFVWRPAAEEVADDLDRLLDDSWRQVFNLSVWESIETLRRFTYQDEHLAIMRQSGASGWFDPATSRHALWWIPQGHRPTVGEALAHLDHLGTHGPTPDTFTFRQDFPPAPRRIDRG